MKRRVGWHWEKTRCHFLVVVKGTEYVAEVNDCFIFCTIFLNRIRKVDNSKRFELLILGVFRNHCHLK